MLKIYQEKKKWWIFISQMIINCTRYTDYKITTLLIHMLINSHFKILRGKWFSLISYKFTVFYFTVIAFIIDFLLLFSIHPANSDWNY